MKTRYQSNSEFIYHWQKTRNYKKLEIELEIDKNREYEFETDKNLENLESNFEFLSISSLF